MPHRKQGSVSLLLIISITGTFFYPPSPLPRYLLLLSEEATWGPLNKTNTMKPGLRIKSLVIHVGLI